MTIEELQAYLHAEVPLSRHMQVSVRLAERERVVLHMPLAPNVNPHGTVFGGAQAAVGLIGGWMLLHAAYAREGIRAHIVGKEGRYEFLAPATADCEVETRCESADLDALFVHFRQFRRARQALTTVVRAGGVEASRHHGVYTAFTPESLPATDRKPAA